MKGFDIDPDTNRMSIINDSRTVTTTEGTLICLLPTVYSFLGQTVTFPDFSKDIAYIHTQDLDSNFEFFFSFGEGCSVFITAIPQELSTKTTLMAAPAGADFFIGHVRLSRTTAPASTWQQETIGVLPVQNQWINTAGAFSTLVEAQWGMARAFHIYIDSSNNLVIERQQSVGTAAGGYGSWQGPISQGYRGSGSIVARTTQGMPIFARAGAKARGYIGTNNPQVEYRINNGSSSCASSDVTNYTSVYTVDVVGRFGRRS